MVVPFQFLFQYVIAAPYSAWMDFLMLQLCCPFLFNVNFTTVARLSVIFACFSICVSLMGIYLHLALKLLFCQLLRMLMLTSVMLITMAQYLYLQSFQSCLNMLYCALYHLTNYRVFPKIRPKPKIRPSPNLKN